MALTGGFDHWFRVNRQRFQDAGGRRTDKHPALDVSVQFQRLCEAIKEGHLGAIATACEFLAFDPHMPFGRTIKSQIARALKAVPDKLSSGQINFLYDYADKLGELSHPPREYAEFCKLLRRIERHREQLRRPNGR